MNEIKKLENVRPLREAVMKYIYRALFTKQWNRCQTAKALGISIRGLRDHITRMRKAGYEIPESTWTRTKDI